MSLTTPFTLPQAILFFVVFFGALMSYIVYEVVKSLQRMKGVSYKEAFKEALAIESRWKRSWIYMLIIVIASVYAWFTEMNAAADPNSIRGPLIIALLFLYGLMVF